MRTRQLSLPHREKFSSVLVVRIFDDDKIEFFILHSSIAIHPLPISCNCENLEFILTSIFLLLVLSRHHGIIESRNIHGTPDTLIWKTTDSFDSKKLLIYEVVTFVIPSSALARRRASSGTTTSAAWPGRRAIWARALPNRRTSTTCLGRPRWASAASSTPPGSTLPAGIRRPGWPGCCSWSWCCAERDPFPFFRERRKRRGCRASCRTASRRSASPLRRGNFWSTSLQAEAPRFGPRSSGFDRLCCCDAKLSETEDICL